MEKGPRGGRGGPRPREGVPASPVPRFPLAASPRPRAWPAAGEVAFRGWRRAGGGSPPAAHRLAHVWPFGPGLGVVVRPCAPRRGAAGGGTAAAPRSPSGTPSPAPPLAQCGASAARPPRNPSGRRRRVCICLPATLLIFPSRACCTPFLLLRVHAHFGSGLCQPRGSSLGRLLIYLPLGDGQRLSLLNAGAGGLRRECKVVSVICGVSTPRPGCLLFV